VSGEAQALINPGPQGSGSASMCLTRNGGRVALSLSSRDLFSPTSLSFGNETARVRTRPALIPVAHRVEMHSIGRRMFINSPFSAAPVRGEKAGQIGRHPSVKVAGYAHCSLR
jgi:hypothetical protein